LVKNSFARQFRQAESAPVPILHHRNSVASDAVCASSFRVGSGEPLFQEIQFIGERGPAYAALDLSASRALTALGTVFTEGEEDKIDVVPHFWLAGDLREHEDTDKAPCSLWRQQGYLLHGLPIKSLAIVRRPRPANPTRQVDGAL
jgi:hypothetical protein